MRINGIDFYNSANPLYLASPSQIAAGLVNRRTIPETDKIDEINNKKRVEEALPARHNMLEYKAGIFFDVKA